MPSAFSSASVLSAFSSLGAGGGASEPSQGGGAAGEGGGEGGGGGGAEGAAGAAGGEGVAVKKKKKPKPPPRPKTDAEKFAALMEAEEWEKAAHFAATSPSQELRTRETVVAFQASRRRGRGGACCVAWGVRPAPLLRAGGQGDRRRQTACAPVLRRFARAQGESRGRGGREEARGGERGREEPRGDERSREGPRGAERGREAARSLTLKLRCARMWQGGPAPPPEDASTRRRRTGRRRLTVEVAVVEAVGRADADSP